MKGILVTINMALSFVGLSIDTEKSPLWAVIVIVIWFVASVLLMKYANSKRWINY